MATPGEVEGSNVVRPRLARYGAARLAWLATAVLSSVIAAAGCGIFPDSDSAWDNRQFDKIEAEFAQDSGAFEAVADHMDQLLAENPDAQRIGWTYSMMCITTPEKGKVCNDASDKDREVFELLPNPDGVFFFSRDPKRYYLTFHQDDPPEIYVMFAPNDGDPAAFAAERGFRSFRAINEDWSLLGYIVDEEKSDAQWGA